ncbi:hypothetical protein QFC19_001119 [Naganishia cerealis]|uniref:Uncharacterized protein n=1 Tax=Naganishia cerealis TaxID=610337 RepID=A0ACC2WIU8_9TREE|nr:hypothetical protein QFC19_001119 [Naganishia cerealis]
MMHRALKLHSSFRPKAGFRHVAGLSTLAKAKANWGDRLVVSEEVEHALETGSSGVVALETAIVTHGMPHPTNYDCALSVESLIRAQSSIPATIALLSGRIHIGLSQSQLAHLADPAINAKSIKLSRRDLARGIYSKVDAGTTVAGTMMLARQVGIDVFVTGGIGGVHRGAERSMDISADLHELGRTPMGVVCAGAKSILDLGLTLEVLETLGVNVTTIGTSNDFPAFYSPKSGFKSSFFVRNASEAASLLHTSLNLPTPQAQLFACPIPEEYHAQGEVIQQAVEQAVRESVDQGVDKKGKEVTPWLLKRVGELTQGKALKSNIALIENNATIGGRIAAELNRLKQGSSTAPISPPCSGIKSSLESPKTSKPGTYLSSKSNPPEVLVFGAAAIDITSRISSGSVASAMHTTAPGKLQITPGGVGRNIAECASRMSNGERKVMLVSAVGAQDTVDGTVVLDSFGLILDREMKVSGMRTDGLLRQTRNKEEAAGGEGARTAVCNLILDDKAGLVIGVADMDIVESITAQDVSDGFSVPLRRRLTRTSPVVQIRETLDIHQPKTVAFDANLAPEVMTCVLEECFKRDITVIHDPTSLPKMLRLLPAIQQHQGMSHQRALITHYTPNILELKTLYEALRSNNMMETERWWSFIDSLQLDHDWRNNVEQFARKSGQKWIGQDGVVQMMISLLPWVENLWLKCGDKGIVYLGLQPLTAMMNPGCNIPERTVTKSFRKVPMALMDQPERKLVLAHYSAKTLPSIISTTGAGDSFVGGLLAQINDNPHWRRDIDRVVDVAMGCAEMSLVSEKAVGMVETLRHNV